MNSRSPWLRWSPQLGRVTRIDSLEGVVNQDGDDSYGWSDVQYEYDGIIKRKSKY